MSYPIGSIYQSTNSTNPSNIFGGTWSQIKDRFLLACGDSYANGSVGGEASHTLTINEIPSHTHCTYIDADFSAAYTGNNNAWKQSLVNATNSTVNPNYTFSYTGGSSAHNNMPPYFAIYTWYRTA